MELVWWPGVAHEGVTRRVNTRHVLRVRTACGAGADAVGSDRLRPLRWRAGALEYLPPGTDHSHYSTWASDWVTIEVEAAEWGGLLELAGSRLKDPVVCETGRSLPRPDRVLQAWRSSRTAGLDDVAAPLALALELIGALSHAPLRSPPRGLAERALRDVTEFVEAHLSEPIPLPQMAQVAGLTRFHFIAAFRQATGQTPHQYLLGRRLVRARELLRRRPDLRIAAVAAECGLASQAHLCGLFAKRYGCTPGRFRSFKDDAVVCWRASFRPARR
jgi:AraC family transcriptional regulator